MNESDLIRKIQAYLKTVPGMFFWKEHGGYYGTAGVPDIICCFKGRFVAFEVKTEKGKTTALQEVCMRKIISAGGTATVVRSVEQVRRVIESAG
jgi:hypothetical protein